MKSIRIISTLKHLIPMLLFMIGNLSAQQPSEFQSGLIGLLYQDTNLTRMSSVWILDGLDSDVNNWQSKNDFSAQWIGYIKAPISGEIKIHGEADNEIRVLIDGKSIIDTWEGNNKTDGDLKVVESKLYPILIKYRQISGPSFMKLSWSWNGQGMEIIPSSVLFYNKDDKEKIFHDFRASIDKNCKELNFDIASIIEINKPEDVAEKRNALIKMIWGDKGLPFEKLPDEIVEGISDSDFVSLNNLKRIDKLVINMDFGLNSIAYHFIPTKSNGDLVIYHQGHDGKFSLGIRTINAFLKHGYNVIALSMPIKGMNNKPIVNLKKFGKVRIASHEQFRFLTPKTGHPVKYFLEPVTTVINYAEKFNFKKIIMIGISGGGWTTTQYAAIDPRISVSFPVAGSLPEYLRMRATGNLSTLYGDYEQSIPEILNIANYLELYVMGAYGKGRSQLQILNEFDDCCFRGTGARTYQNIVKNRVNSLGLGGYDLFIDSTHMKHQISPKALEVIFEYLKKL